MNSRRPGLGPDIPLHCGDGSLVALDQLGDDGRIGLDRGRLLAGAGRAAGGCRTGPFVGERRDEVTAVEDGLQRLTDQRV